MYKCWQRAVQVPTTITDPNLCCYMLDHNLGQKKTKHKLFKNTIFSNLGLKQLLNITYKEAVFGRLFKVIKYRFAWIHHFKTFD